jgi:ABC-type cobalamin/Fe3+-siderophores transport system ATPase subunit
MLNALNIFLNADGKTLLNDINFSADKGRFICVAGANGSGKTLLLKTLAGILKPVSGKVILDGEDISFYTAAKRSARLRFIGAESQSAFDFKALDIAVMGTNPQLKWWQDYSAAQYAAARKAMEQTGVLELAQRNIFTLSSGELQRVFIAQALSCGPDVLIADEPTSHLDLKQKKRNF